MGREGSGVWEGGGGDGARVRGGGIGVSRKTMRWWDTGSDLLTLPAASSVMLQSELGGGGFTHTVKELQQVRDAGFWVFWLKTQQFSTAVILSLFLSQTVNNSTIGNPTAPLDAAKRTAAM